MNPREIDAEKTKVRNEIEKEQKLVLFKSSFLALSEKELEQKLGKIALCGDFPEIGYPVGTLKKEVATLKEDIEERRYFIKFLRGNSFQDHQLN